MDLDFLLITFIYLVIILSTHIYLKKYDTVLNIENDESSGLENDQYNNENNNTYDENDDNLIVNRSEIYDNNESTNEFIKYLDIENSDKISALQNFDSDTNKMENELSNEIAPQNIDTLDKYFKNIKEDNQEIVFEPVPTNSNQDYSSKGLLMDIKKLNDDNVYDNVNAFDDFTATYAPI
tara:strand:+ start:5689 stop:6228 length:540 start_codon:yes stop_codon:yes gene_type:complete